MKGQNGGSNGKPSADPMAEMAAFTDKSGQTVTVTVDASGTFTIHLAAGSYGRAATGDCGEPA